MRSLLFRLTAFLFFAANLGAADWAQWRGPDRTGHVPAGAPVPSTLPAEPKVLWRIKVTDGLSSPVVAAGKVYHLDIQNNNEQLHCLDAATGTELWQTNTDKAHKDHQSASGPRGTAMIDGDRLYVQSCRGELRCLNVADGSLIWRANFGDDFGAIFIGETGNAMGARRHGNNGSPIADGDVLYAQVGSTNGASIVAFEKKTGKVIWKSQSDEAGYGAPVIAKIGGVRQLISFTVEGVIGLALPDGKLLWRVSFTTAFGRHAITPVIVDDMVVVSSHQAGLIGVKVSGKNGSFEAAKAWTNMDSAINFSSPVAVGNYLYGLGPTKNVECIDIKTGAQQWSKQGYINTSADKAYSGFIVMDKNILVLTDGGQLVLFAADPKEFKEVSVAQVCGKNWCNPAYSDGKLFLRDGRELLCIDLSH